MAAIFRYFCYVLMASISVQCFGWNLNDVSLLMPLPLESSPSAFLQKASDHGEVGELLGLNHFEKIGVLSNSSEDSNGTYRNLRAISYRVDPCPAESSAEPHPHSCRPELRIVWQPVIWDATHKYWTTEDAAIHSFYRLSPSQFQNLIAQLRFLKHEAENHGITTELRPLGIHPAMAHSTLGDRFRKEWFRAVLQNTGEKNIYRITFMKLMVPDNWWKFFTGFVRGEDGIWKTASIPRHIGTEMDYLNDAVNVNPSTGQIDEADAGIFSLIHYPEQDDLRYILSTGFRKTMFSWDPNEADLSQFKRGIEASLRFQNPNFTNPQTVDCVHCHVANAAQTFALKVFPELKSFLTENANHYTNPDPTHFNLEVKSIATQSTKAVRAFGYVGNFPSVMTRTVHDSAQSADWLNKLDLNSMPF